MTAWMKADYFFANRLLQLELTRHDLINLGLHELMTATGTDSVDLLEAALRIVIEQERPALVGCTVLMMTHDHQSSTWAVVVEHPCLPHVPAGTTYPRESLIKRDKTGTD